MCKAIILGLVRLSRLNGPDTDTMPSGHNATCCGDGPFESPVINSFYRKHFSLDQGADAATTPSGHSATCCGDHDAHNFWSGFFWGVVWLGLTGLATGVVYTATGGLDMGVCVMVVFFSVFTLGCCSITGCGMSRREIENGRAREGCVSSYDV